MVRVADHDARRAQVAHAVEQLIGAGGLDSVTVARTAAAAGISVGLVQHYFPSKDDMLLHTYERLRARIEGRIAVERDAGERAGARIEWMVLDGMSQLLPLDDERRRECRVALSFAGRAVDNPRLADTLRVSNARLRDQVAEALRSGKECGEVPESVPDRATAVDLLALLDGLVLNAFTDPSALPPARAREVLADQLGRIFTGVCRLRST